PPLPPPRPTLFPYTTLFRSAAQTDLTGDWVLTITSPQGPRDLSAKLKQDGEKLTGTVVTPRGEAALEGTITGPDVKIAWKAEVQDRKSTRLNSSHVSISYAV